MRTLPRPAWPAVGIRVRIGLTFAALALVMFLVVGGLSARLAGTQAAADAGDALNQLAVRMASALDTDMFERYREVQNLATLGSMSVEPLQPQRWRVTVDQLQRSFRHYAWIGLAASDGTVLASTGGVLEGVSVAKRGWFQSARGGPFAGNVHDAVLLAKKLPPRPAGEPLRLVDVAAPIVQNGQLVAVLGAHLDWAWAAERRRAVVQAAQADRGMELLVVDATGDPLLGVNGQPDARPRRRVADLLAQRHAVETWSDGRRYLTVAVPCAGYRDYAGLGWAVLARQPIDSAMASANALRWQIASFGAVGAVLFGLFAWWLSGWLTGPLRRVVAQALAVSPSELPTLGRRGLDEVAQLSQTLGDLVTQLRARERELVALNQNLEQRVTDRTARLEQANADLRSFSHSVSHDLKGPIGSIGLGIKLAVDQAGSTIDPGSTKILAALVDECDRVRSLVDDLMALAQVEQRALSPERVAMNELVRLVVDDVRRQVAIGVTPGRAATTVELGELPDGVGDAVLLRQVWHNLIANAFKFSAGSVQPLIRIGAESSGGECIYSVADNGAGFDAAKAGRLFGLFQRLHRQEEFPGTGVGLSIVKRIVHRHGGRVWARSEAGQGATFFVALPLTVAVVGDAAALVDAR